MMTRIALIGLASALAIAGSPALAATAAQAPAAKAPAATAPASEDAAKTIAALKKRIAAVRHQIGLQGDYDEIEKLESTYSYYLDKSLWNQLIDLFSPTVGEIELAQRGAYRGEHLRPGVLSTFAPTGNEGPSVNRIGDHQNVQPVIHVAPDGKTAKVRIRLIQMMGGAGGAAQWGGGVYENEMIKEDGIWKIKTDHVYNTFTMPYNAGPSAGGAGGLPGPNPRFPPDHGPSLVFKAYPNVYDIPIHFTNPVTGK